MTIDFPSREFDEAVAAVCHHSLTEDQARALNALLRTQAAARDEYIRRLEIHARLASSPDCFAAMASTADSLVPAVTATAPPPAATLPATLPAASPRPGHRPMIWAIAAAAALALGGAAWRHLLPPPPAGPMGPMGSTSAAVALLHRVAEAEWSPGIPIPRLAAPLAPGRLRLQSGLAQIVFYSGARIVIEGPSELELVSAHEAVLHRGRMTAEVPPQARGFSIVTPGVRVVDRGTTLGLAVAGRRTELHVFAGSVALRPAAGGPAHDLRDGQGAVVEETQALRFIPAAPSAFATHFDLQAQALAAEARRHHQWRASSNRWHDDPSLLVHLDFEAGASDDWRLRNLGNQTAAIPDAAIVGCQWIRGRWPEKRALEFQGVSDRVRLDVPGEFASVTLAAWVRVQGLDRPINALFMSDGFLPGTLHWVVRHDGALGLTVIGDDPRHHQIIASPPVVTLDQLGQWLHLAVVLDGSRSQVVHYLNGAPVAEQALEIQPPFRIGESELGNWHPRGFSRDDPFHLRHFSGAMDEFLLFDRPLRPTEIATLCADGSPQPEPPATPKKAP